MQGRECLGEDRLLKKRHSHSDPEVMSRPEGARGSVRLPKRWVVERTFAGLGRYRRLSEDDERRRDWSASLLRVGAIDLMLRRLAKPATKDPRSATAKPPEPPNSQRNLSG